MEKLKKIKKTIKEHKLLLKERFKVKSVAVFGSYLRGKQKKESDIDILVEFYEPIDLFKFVELENFLTQTLGRKVDLVMKEALKPRLKEKILEEAVVL